MLLNGEYSVLMTNKTEIRNKRNCYFFVIDVVLNAASYTLLGDFKSLGNILFFKTEVQNYRDES